MSRIVSILILTYNRKTLSSACIPNILDNIGNTNHEVLIWDNGSTDGTFDWLQEYGRADNRITKIFGNDENIGLEAINNLANEAKGQYLLKIDDDIAPPPNFARRIVDAYEEIDDDNLLFLSWDMEWGKTTFAMRSGMKLYKEPRGKTVQLKSGERALIHYTPSVFMVNGACRLSKKDKFFEIGGHPEGMKYGTDHHVSIRAEKYGYYTGFLSSPDLLKHEGKDDSPEYRKMKDYELKRNKAPKNV